jgi:hypothetical protein
MAVHISTETDVVRDAAARGFWLAQRPLDNGEPAWVWLDDDDRPRPSFLTRRQAIDYMSEKLGISDEAATQGTWSGASPPH